MTENKLCTWAEGVVKYLGDGWSVVSNADNENACRIVHVDGRSLHVFTPYYSRDSFVKAEISGDFPRGVYMRSRDPKINVSMTRDPKITARDITRRLINEYTPMYQDALKRKQEQDEDAARLAVVRQQVIDAFPGGREGREDREVSTDGPTLRLSHESVFKDGKVIYTGGFEVGFTHLRVSLADAMKIAAILRGEH